MEQVRTIDYLPQVLAQVVKEASPTYDECPDQINLSGSGLGELLQSFKTTSDRMTAELMLKISKIEDLDGAGKRTVRDSYWWTEFHQSVYLVAGKFVSDGVVQGAEASSLFAGGTRDLRARDKKIFVHSHPSLQTFSGSDIRMLMLGIDPVSYLGVEPEVVYPPLKMLLLTTDMGNFMTFVCSDTHVISETEGKKYGMVLVKNGERELSELYRTSLQDLEERYNLSYFKGDSLRKVTLFPEGLNEHGIALVNLDATLKLMNRVNLPLYYCPSGDTSYSRVNTIEDCYPEYVRDSMRKE